MCYCSRCPFDERCDDIVSLLLKSLKVEGICAQPIRIMITLWDLQATFRQNLAQLLHHNRSKSLIVDVTVNLLTITSIHRLLEQSVAKKVYS